MTLNEAYRHLRTQIGSPSVNQTGDLELLPYIEGSISRHSDEVELGIRYETQAIGLTAEQVEIPLPGDFKQILWVEWNGARLKAENASAWRRDRIDPWSASSGNPSRYSVEGLKIALYPKPSSGAVTTDPVLSVRYLSTVSLNGQQLSQASDADWWVIVLGAACDWMAQHPTKENMVTLQYVAKQYENRLAAARRRGRDQSGAGIQVIKPKVYRDTVAR